jgi:hypothetical protein
MKPVEERAKGKSYSEAAIAAGYSEKNARQFGYQAMQQLRGRVPDLHGPARNRPQETGLRGSDHPLKVVP